MDTGFQDERTQVDANSIRLIFNGANVTPTVAKASGRTTLTYQPDPNRTQTTNQLALTYADTAVALGTTYTYRLGVIENGS